MAFNQPAPTLLAATIAAGASLSPQINLGAQTLHGILIPAGWTAAGLTFQVSVDNGATFHEMNDNTATAISAAVTAGGYAALNPELWRAVNVLKIRSGMLHSPVNQAAPATLTLVLSTIV